MTRRGPCIFNAYGWHGLALTLVDGDWNRNDRWTRLKGMIVVDYRFDFPI